MKKHLKLMILVLFSLWEDARVCIKIIPLICILSMQDQYQVSILNYPQGTLWGAVWWLLPKKKNVFLPYDPTIISLLVFIQRSRNLCPHHSLHTDVYTALFIVAKTWKQPRCPSVGEWINCVISCLWNIIQH